MNDENFNMNIIDQNFFLPNEDIFSIFLNAGENKNTENMNETLDQFFKVDNNFNIFNNFFENNNLDTSNNIEQSGLTKKKIKKEKNNEDLLSKKSKKPLRSKDFKDIKDTKDKARSSSTQAVIKTEESSFSFTSDNTDNKKQIFKTFKEGDGEDGQDCEMRKMMRLMKNRLSARKCRQKKKHYMDNIESKISQLQNELDGFKKIQKKEKLVENLLGNMENREKEILCISNISSSKNTNKKKMEGLKKDYTNFQKSLISELMKKLITNIMPVEYKVFSHKFIKLREIDSTDTLDTILTKIDVNIELLAELYNFSELNCNKKNQLDTFDHSNNNNFQNTNKSNNLNAYKIFEFYNNLKK